MNHSPIRFGLALCYGLSALLVLLLFYGCAAVTAEPASVEAPRAAASACIERDKIAAELRQKYNESVIVRAMMDMAMIEVFASPQGETWTIVVTLPDCLTLPLAAGTDWQELIPQPEGTNL